MRNYSDTITADNGETAHDIYIVDQKHYDAWLNGQAQSVQTLLQAQKFEAKPHEMAIVNNGNDDFSVVLGVKDQEKLSVWCLSKVSESLNKGRYRLVGDGDHCMAYLGWILGQYQFDHYKNMKNPGVRTLLTKDINAAELAKSEAEAQAMVRDLINTPAEDMGPEQLEDTARKLADEYDAKLEVISGDALEQGYPMIHAVGKAAARSHAPRLIELHWGQEDHPHIALVGKGVCFDSGGLDIKSAAGMLLMKKDMGGSAHVLALAMLIMRYQLPVRLHMLVAAVENGISAGAMRPGDVLKSRKGVSVEVKNTDAEGRLVLGDALDKAGDGKPELVIDFATLTGAARVALVDVPPVFSNNDDLAKDIMGVSHDVGDPLWHMPLWQEYEEMLSSDIADISNSGGGFAGSITAAIFLKKFIPDNCDWVHIDTYGWRPAVRPGQPKGGEALGMRAIWRFLKLRYASN